MALPGLLLGLLAWAGPGDEDPTVDELAEVTLPDDAGDVEEATAEELVLRDCFEGGGAPEPAVPETGVPEIRRHHLSEDALTRCLAEGGARDLAPTPEPCFAAYRALPEEADEAAWLAADAEVQACFEADPSHTGTPRLLGGVVAVPGRYVVAGYDPETGEQHWVAPGCEEWLAPTVAGATDIDVLDCVHELRAVDGATGATRWTLPVPAGLAPKESQDGRPGVAVGPTVAALVVDDELVAIDLADGTERWRRALDGAPEDLAVSSALVVVSTDGTVEGFGVADGAPELELDVGRRASVLADDDGVVVRADAHRLLAIDPTGWVRWDVTIGGDLTDGPVRAATPDLVLVDGWGSGDDGRLRAVDRRDGSIRWSAPHRAPASFSGGAVAASSELVAFVDDDCDLRVVDALEGEERLRVDTWVCSARMTLAGGRLHHLRQDGAPDQDGDATFEHAISSP